MQTDVQNTPHTTKRKPLAHWFRPGVSGNPGGKSRAQLRYAAFLEQFRGVHGRAPTATEITSLRNAAALASKIEGYKIPVTEQVRAGNLLTRLLDRLGLAPSPPPAPAKPDAFPDIAKFGGGK